MCKLKLNSPPKKFLRSPHNSNIWTPKSHTYRIRLSLLRTPFNPSINDRPYSAFSWTLQRHWGISKPDKTRRFKPCSLRRRSRVMSCTLRWGISFRFRRICWLTGLTLSTPMDSLKGQRRQREMQNCYVTKLDSKNWVTRVLWLIRVCCRSMVKLTSVSRSKSGAISLVVTRLTRRHQRLSKLELRSWRNSLIVSMLPFLPITFRRCSWTNSGKFWRKKITSLCKTSATLRICWTIVRLRRVVGRLIAHAPTKSC